MRKRLTLICLSVWLSCTLLPTVEAETMETVQVRIVDFGQINSRYREEVGFAQGSDGGTGRPFKILDDVDLDGNPETDDWIETWPFSLQKPMSPQLTWWDDSWVSSRFYGGITFYYINRPEKNRGITEWYNNSAESDETMQPASDFALHMANNIIGSPFRGYAAWLWKKEDFLHGASGDSARVRFDDSSIMALYRQRHWGGYDGVRFAVQNGEQFYVSEVLPDNWRLGRGGSGPYDLQKACPAQLRWAKWNPVEGDHRLEFDPKTPHEKIVLDDVRAVGWYLYKDDPREVQTAFKYESFEVIATVERPLMKSEILDLVELAPAGLPAFMMHRTELSYQEWKQIFRWSESIGQWALDMPGMVYDKNGDMGSMDYSASHGLDRTHTHSEPATDFTFYDALAWCNALSEFESRECVYYTDADFTQPFRDVIKGPWLRDPAVHQKPTIHVKWAADGYRLPTPSEWLAAGTPADWADRAARENGTEPVRSGEANEKAFHGLNGNVWELVWTFGDRLDPEPETITAMGGGFAGSLNPLEVSASPYGDRPYFGSSTIGMRPVRRLAGLPAPPTAMPESAVPVWVIARDDRSAARPAAPLELSFVTVPEGTYSGKVRMSSFQLHTTELTFRQWKQGYDWAVANGFTFDRDGDMGSMYFRLQENAHHPDEPVTGISYFDMLAWCNAVSLMQERKPVFYADEARQEIYRSAWRYRPVQLRNIDYEGGPRGVSFVYSWTDAPGRRAWMDWSADGLRPPTMAEWGYAYAGGSNTVFPWGDAFNEDADRHAWWLTNSGMRTHRVGQLAPNGYGLFDMAGNAAEMTVDSAGKGARDVSDQTLNPIEFFTPYSFSSKWRIAFLKSSFLYNEPKFFSNPPVFGGGWAAGTPGWYWPDQGFRPAISNAYPPDGYAPGYVRTDVTALDLTGKTFDTLQGRTHRANLQRDGIFQASGLKTLGGLKWKAPTQGPVRSSPVVVEGTVYVGSDDGTVYAFDAGTGASRWAFKTGGPVRSSATVLDGRVFIGSNDGKLYALSAENGEELWSVRVGESDGRKGVIQSSPAVAYGIVFIGGGAPDQGLETFSGSTRAARGYDVATGEEVWVQKNGGSPDGMSSIALADGLMVCPSNTGIGVYDMRTGDQIGGGSLYSSGGILHSTPILTDAGIFVPNSLEATVLEWSLQGKKLWYGWCHADPKNRTLIRAGREVFGSMVVLNETIYVPGNNGKIYTFATKAAGSAWDKPVQGWTLDLGTPIKSSFSAADGVLYFGAEDGAIRAIPVVAHSAETPSVAWKYATAGPIWSSPWLGEGVLYIGSDDGNIYCLE